jgi:hypothetical protein
MRCPGVDAAPVVEVARGWLAEHPAAGPDRTALVTLVESTLVPEPG